MISRSDRKKMMDYVEKSKADKKADKKMGENSFADIMDDKARAQRMSPRGNKNQRLLK